MDGQGTSMGVHDDPFFDLLQSTVPPPSVIHSNPRKEDNSLSDFSFGQDEVLPSYDFHPIRSNGIGGSSSSKATSSTSTTRHDESSLNGSKGRQSSPPRPSYAPADPPVYRSREPPITYESSIQRLDHIKDSLESATVAAVERTMKKYADVLLRVLEGMSGRLSQLENTTQRLEHSVQVLKSDAANHHGESDGKLRMLENHIKEVQRGVQILRDKQEISEAHSQLVKLQLVKSEAPASATSDTASVDVPTKLLNVSNGQQPEALVQQSHVAPHQPPLATQTPVALQQVPAAPQAPASLQQPPAAPQAPANIQQQQLPALPAPPVVQTQPTQLPEQQIQPLVFPASSTISAPPQVPTQQPYAPSPHPHQQPSHSLQMQSFYNQPPHIQQQYAHQPEAVPFSNVAQGPQLQGIHPLPQGSQSQRPHQVQSPPVYHPTETSYPPTTQVPPPQPQSFQQVPPPQPQSFQQGPPPQPQSFQQGPPPQPQSFQIPPQQLGASVQQMYDPSFGQSNSGAPTLSAPYIPQAQPLQGSPVYESQALVPSSAYNNPNYRVAQPLPSAPGGGGYPRLPVAQPIQQSLPHASIPSGPSVQQNRGHVDDVVEKVAAMGFSRDQARAVIRRLAENGQSADLNVVLDKLTNGGEAQPQRGWFGR
ncbi:hypothetical protein O6H91_21G029600 [Diphasiastrum complanatum]|uniref:Uncharacterized protein n=4 Tax=Diphasiastrum complanatum TaxID=34168 RepID=A0ACC2AJ33_DIPCM|nr:hypothetical protein O6H91_Y395600 [Diphasiastrum complanatum]KAJ7271441.1 hypothetical protein O6H91_Y395600 [Diphasiastrum complanatum]KAJ7271442.1 hypothetical protein O6H91_Y395600 [Diphasiastrum complanatum]KAJ7271443.1 hypothetical protein O6H91_Y395600 [Diphasiastrum complanatum]KAJ7517562.1 hypothetical protein O6H91_21G029600 [Diphasiastrum complanatum]